jgi:hypothetical protein
LQIDDLVFRTLQTVQLQFARGSQLSRRRSQCRRRLRCQASYYIGIQHFSDRYGSAMFRISLTNLRIWSNSLKNPMQFDLFQTSSKFYFLGRGSIPHSALTIFNECKFYRISIFRYVSFRSFDFSIWRSNLQFLGV